MSEVTRKPAGTCLSCRQPVHRTKMGTMSWVFHDQPADHSAVTETDANDPEK